MPDTTKTIGTLGGEDYSTVAAWLAAMPANLVTDGHRQVGLLSNQKFTAGVTITGLTTNASNYVYLKCASGASFRDQAGVRTTALHYNPANGATIEAGAGAISTFVDFTLIEGLQLKDTGYASVLALQGANCIVRDCIITSAVGGRQAGGDSSGQLWANCLFEYGSGTSAAGDGCLRVIGRVEFCTFVCTTTSTSANAIHLPYNVGIVKNCAVFGFTTFTDGTPAAGSDYNATDLASAVTGTHNQTSLAFSAQFVSTTVDFRSKSTGGLKNGTPDTGFATDDISGQSRDATTPYIGAWEASASAPSFTITPSDIPKNHSGNITLTLAGTLTTWGGTTTFTLSGVTGATKVSHNVTGSTAATLVLTTGSGTGTLTIQEGVTGTASATTTVSLATLVVSPTSGVVSTTPTLTLTGTHTLWTTETAAGLTSVSGVSGVSIATPTVSSNTSATAVLTIGTSTGTVTITDNSTGAFTTFTVTAVSGTITITSPVQWQTFQRNATGLGAGTASIPVSGTWADGPSGSQIIEASWNGAAYATLATVTAGSGLSGSYSGTLTGQAAGQGTLTVRFKNLTSASASKTFVGVGDVFLVAGQSNAVGFMTANQTYSHATLKAAAYGSTAADLSANGPWKEGNDPFNSAAGQGSPWPLLATWHMQDQGVPCAFIEAAIGGRALANDPGNATNNPWYWTKYRPDTGAQPAGYAKITAQVTASGVNSVKGVLWYQGENDADGLVDQPTYLGAFLEFVNNIHADLAGSPKVIPMLFGGDSLNQFYPPVNLAIAAAANSSPNVLGMPAIWDQTNDLHLTTQGQGQTAANRFWAVIKSELFGGTSGNGHGPRIVAAQHNAARTSITVSFDKVLKTGLSLATSVWTVTGNGVSVGVSNVVYHGTDVRSVVLVLGSAAALPIVLSFCNVAATAGLVVPLGPDFALPDSTTINLPAEPFANLTVAAADGGGSGVTVTGGGLQTARGFSGGVN